VITSNEIQQLIGEELIEEKFDNWHGITLANIHNYLLKPILKEYIRAADGLLGKYWLVLDECPNDKVNGYQIIFDEVEQEFGLAVKSNMANEEFGTMLGFYGSFTDTLNNM